jgi:hypothetical protein
MRHTDFRDKAAIAIMAAQVSLIKEGTLGKLSDVDAPDVRAVMLQAAKIAFGFAQALADERCEYSAVGTSYHAISDSDEVKLMTAVNALTEDGSRWHLHSLHATVGGEFNMFTVYTAVLSDEGFGIKETDA